MKAAEDGMKNGTVKAGRIDRIKDLTPYYKQQTENASSSSASNGYNSRNNRPSHHNRYEGNARSTNSYGRGQHYKPRDRKDDRDRDRERDRRNHRDRDRGRSQIDSRDHARSRDRKHSQDRDRENGRSHSEHRDDHNRQHSRDHHNENKDNRNEGQISRERSADRRPKRPLQLSAELALCDFFQGQGKNYEEILKALSLSEQMWFASHIAGVDCLLKNSAAIQERTEEQMSALKLKLNVMLNKKMDAERDFNKAQEKLAERNEALQEQFRALQSERRELTEKRAHWNADLAGEQADIEAAMLAI